MRQRLGNAALLHRQETGAIRQDPPLIASRRVPFYQEPSASQRIELIDAQSGLTEHAAQRSRGNFPVTGNYRGADAFIRLPSELDVAAPLAYYSEARSL